MYIVYTKNAYSNNGIGCKAILTGGCEWTLVYISEHECTWVKVIVHQWTWVYVSVHECACISKHEYTAVNMRIHQWTGVNMSVVASLSS